MAEPQQMASLNLSYGHYIRFQWTKSFVRHILGAIIWLRSTWMNIFFFSSGGCDKTCWPTQNVAKGTDARANNITKYARRERRTECERRAEKWTRSNWFSYYYFSRKIILYSRLSDMGAESCRDRAVCFMSVVVPIQCDESRVYCR